MTEHPQPYISLDDVRTALDSLIATQQSKSFAPLLELSLIDEYLLQHDLPASDSQRTFVLHRILAELIETNLVAVRATYELPHRNEQETRQRALRRLSAEVDADKRELLHWSLLYYRYLRDDLQITNDEFAAHLHIVKRTVIRSFVRAAERIRDSLIELEWHARHTQRTRRLLSRIPASTHGTLFGREAIHEHFVAHISNQLGLVTVTGEAGVGKTALVASITEHLVAEGHWQQLVWVDAVTSAEAFKNVVTTQSLPEVRRVDWAQYTLVNPTLIVLDNASALSNADLIACVEWVSRAQLIVMGRKLPATLIQRAALHLDLPTLGEPASTEFARHLTEVDARVDVDIGDVVRNSGGNPRRLMLGVRGLGEPHALVQNALGALDTRALHAWYMVLLTQADPDAATLLLAPYKSEVVTLAEQHLITESVGSYTIDAPLQPILWATMEQYADAVALVSEIDVALSLDPQKMFLVTAYLLTKHKGMVGASFRLQWMRQLSETGQQYEHCARFVEVLDANLADFAASDALDLRLTRGVCLRRCGQWHAATRAFEQILHIAGTHGYFEQQAEAMLELAVVLRYRGNYEGALKLLERASERIPASLAYLLHLEWAQILVDSGDVRAVHNHLDALRHTSVRGELLRAEVALLQRDYTHAEQQARAILGWLPPKSAAVGLVFTLLSRCRAAMGDFVTACTYATRAVTIFERLDDPFALARARSVLGALLIEAQQHEDAEALLNLAAETQRVIGDAAGLYSTQHNLRLLQRTHD